MSQLVLADKTELRAGAKLSFIRTTDGHSYETYQGPSVSHSVAAIPAVDHTQRVTSIPNRAFTTRIPTS